MEVGILEVIGALDELTERLAKIESVAAERSPGSVQGMAGRLQQDPKTSPLDRPIKRPAAR